LTVDFAEGQLPFSKENPPSVVLPEDDPDAFLNYCKIIHRAQDVQFPVTGLTCGCEWCASWGFGGEKGANVFGDSG
jgi:hypothetical protein